MKYLLLGNGINIQFGGRAYTSEFMMKRIKYRAELGTYDYLFEGSIKSAEILLLLNAFVGIANSLRIGEFDQFCQDTDTKEAVEDFKKRYKNEIKKPHEIMLEDWLLLVHVFYLKHADLEKERNSATAGFNRLLLDAIYNDGKIQTIISHLDKRIQRQIKRFLNQYNAIFTLNYDNNVEFLYTKPVYHLHGDFSVLAESENEKFASGFVRTKEHATVFQDKMLHCYCNALLDYSGNLKRRRMENNEKLIREAPYFSERYANDLFFRSELERLQKKQPEEYKTIMAIIQHPDLLIATDYHYSDFCSITGELHILGMSPNNDAHILDAISKNARIKKLVYYYKSDSEKHIMEKKFGSDVECISVDSLWKSLGCNLPQYNMNYTIPAKIDSFIQIFNALSQDEITKTNAIKEVNKLPQFEIERLCKLVKTDFQKRNPGNASTDEKGFIEQSASISHIALQEGIYPSVLIMICVMFYNEYLK